MQPSDYKIKFEELSCCVIIPTYNNQKTLARVIDSVLEFGAKIIVVNDGATDSTPDILKQFTDKITLVSYSPNKGKGNALRVGFKKAVELGFDNAITIDSDGQHFASDLPQFLEKVEANPGCLIIGARNMNQESVPGKSSFGNKFSNFWFKVETGISMPDTQSGFRLYPVKALNKTRFYTTKFEFEIEVIVKAAWKGIKVVSVPIKVLYNPKERVSHFRPFKDFTRISILNTYLFTLAMLYHRPRLFFKSLKKKSLKEILTKDILSSTDSVKKKSLSVALGMFIGCAPLWGYQTASVFGLAFLFRLNKPIAFLASNISIPPFIPLIIWGSIKIGEAITGQQVKFNLDGEISWDLLMNLLAEHLYVYVIGSLIFSVIMGAVGGLITYFSLSRLAKK